MKFQKGDKVRYCSEFLRDQGLPHLRDYVFEVVGSSEFASPGLGVKFTSGGWDYEERLILDLPYQIRRDEIVRRIL